MKRTFDARPDLTDFRDLMFIPSLIEVQPEKPLNEYRKFKIPILDQGEEGACCGFGLATVVNFLLTTRKMKPGKYSVSPDMLYHLARKYDEWPGADYSGSSARGAIKGWHKHGVCVSKLWKKDLGEINSSIALNSLQHPLGAYFRVNHKDIISMHCALTEVGVLFATATTHSGWGEVGKDGIIPFSSKIEGGHAFAIVAYDQKGFWIQNSWGKDWGKGGFCHMSYSDWLRNGTDAWVGRLGAPMVIELHTTKKGKSTWASASQEKANYQDLRPHALSLGNGGKLESGGMLGNSARTIKTIFTEYFPRITKTWKKKRILLYAHGGLVPEKSALNRIADYRNFLLEKEIYPLFFVWHTGAWDSLKNILAEAIKSRRPEGFISSAKNFMLDRLDDALEPLMRPMGKALWDEMKENAVGASENNNGAQLVVEQLAELAQSEKIEIHIIAHSAGSIFMAPVVNLLKEKNIPVHSLNLWAPACTTDVFEKSYAPLIGNSIKKFSLFTLTDQAEQDDNCGGIYNKSLLYLVSNSFEERFRIPVFQNQGAKILGMEKFASQNNKLKALIKSKKAEWILSPNQESTKSNKSSTASKHGDFDDDANCFRSTVMRILETTGNVPEPKFSRSSVSMGEKRNKLLND